MIRTLLAVLAGAAVIAFAVAWEGRSGLILVLAGAGGLWVVLRLLPGRSLLPGPTSIAERGTTPGESDTDRALDAAPLAVILIDRNGTVTRVNPAARQDLTGLRTGEPLSLALRNPAVLEAVAVCQRDRIAQHTELVERVPAPRAFAVVVAPLEGRSDGASVALFLQDTSGMRRLETMRADFVANASHELRTPLASILGFIETLQGPARDDASARERFLAIMATQARRMARLVDDLLSLSRIEMREHVEPRGSVNAGALLRETADSLSGLAAERGVTLKVDMSVEGTWVTGDRDELLRVFENLIENAIKYGEAGGRVDVLRTPETRPTEIRIAVRDHGEGIAAEHLPRLTERFYRVDPTRSRSEGGTGLGLAIVKHILTRHRGRLEIDSVLGRGSTFTVCLPKAREPARHESVTPPS